MVQQNTTYIIEASEELRQELRQVSEKAGYAIVGQQAHYADALEQLLSQFRGRIHLLIIGADNGGRIDAAQLVHELQTAEGFESTHFALAFGPGDTKALPWFADLQTSLLLKAPFDASKLKHGLVEFKKLKRRFGQRIDLLASVTKARWLMEWGFLNEAEEALRELCSERGESLFFLHLAQVYLLKDQIPDSDNAFERAQHLEPELKADIEKIKQDFAQSKPRRQTLRKAALSIYMRPQTDFDQRFFQDELLTRSLLMAKTWEESSQLRTLLRGTKLKEIEQAKTLEHGLSTLKDHPIDLLITTAQLQGASAIRLITEIRRTLEDPKLTAPRILMRIEQRQTQLAVDAFAKGLNGVFMGELSRKNLLCALHQMMIVEALVDLPDEHLSVGRGLGCLSLGGYHDAVYALARQHQNVIELDPYCQFSLGVALEKRGHGGRARAEFKKAVQKDPGLAVLIEQLHNFSGKSEFSTLEFGELQLENVLSELPDAPASSSTSSRQSSEVSGDGISSDEVSSDDLFYQGGGAADHEDLFLSLPGSSAAGEGDTSTLTEDLDPSSEKQQHQQAWSPALEQEWQLARSTHSEKNSPTQALKTQLDARPADSNASVSVRQHEQEELSESNGRVILKDSPEYLHKPSFEHMRSKENTTLRPSVNALTSESSHPYDTSITASTDEVDEFNDPMMQDPSTMGLQLEPSPQNAQPPLPTPSPQTDRSHASKGSGDSSSAQPSMSKDEEASPAWQDLAKTLQESAAFVHDRLIACPPKHACEIEYLEKLAMLFCSHAGFSRCFEQLPSHLVKPLSDQWTRAQDPLSHPKDLQKLSQIVLENQLFTDAFEQIKQDASTQKHTAQQLTTALKDLLEPFRELHQRYLAKNKEARKSLQRLQKTLEKQADPTEPENIYLSPSSLADILEQDCRSLDTYERLHAVLLNNDRPKELKHLFERFGFPLVKKGMRGYELAKSLLKTGDHQHALCLFSELHRLHPDIPEWGMGAALTALYEKKYTLAENYAHQLLKLNDQYFEAYNILGLSMRRQNRLKESIAYYKAGLAIQPGSLKIAHNLKLVYEALGMKDELTVLERQLRERADQIDESQKNSLMAKLRRKAA